MEEKPKLFQLRREYNTKTGQFITTRQLAEASGVELADVYMMELGRQITRENADKVLRAYSHLTGKLTEAGDVSFILKKEERPVHWWFGIKGFIYDTNTLNKS